MSIKIIEPKPVTPEMMELAKEIAEQAEKLKDLAEKARKLGLNGCVRVEFGSKTHVYISQNRDIIDSFL